MRATTRQPAIDVAGRAWMDMVDIANRATPRETGGILLGYRTGTQVRVVGAAEVADAAATESSYTLLHHAAQARLDEVRHYFPSGSPVGFVGDWHVHPRNLPPSPVDRRSITRLGRHYRRRVATIVVVCEDFEWVPHGLVASRRRSWPCAVRVEEDRTER